MVKEIKFDSMNSIDTIKTFVNVNSLSKCKVTVTSGTYVVDGKSILGLFSLDLSSEFTVKIEYEDEKDLDVLMDDYKQNKVIIS